MQTAIVAKTVLINEKNEILVLRRSISDDVRPGATDFPGGSIDPGEDIMQGAVREILEEVNLVVDQNDLKLAYAKTLLHTKDITLTRLLFIAPCPPDPEIILSHEHDEFWWHPLEEVVDVMDHTSWAEGLEFIKQHNLL